MGTVVMGNPEQSFGIPKSNSQNNLSRNRLDSGYEEENPLISSGTPMEGKTFKDNIDETGEKKKKQNQKLRVHVDCVEKSSKEKEMKNSKKRYYRILLFSLIVLAVLLAV